MLIDIRGRQPIKMRLPIAKHLRHIIWVSSTVQFCGLVSQFTLRKTVHFQNSAGIQFNPGLDIPVPNAITRALERELPEFIAVPQCRFGSFALGDVQQNANAHRTQLIFFDHRRGHLNPLLGTIVQHDAELRRQQQSIADDRLYFLFHPCFVIRVAKAVQATSIGQHVGHLYTIESLHAWADEAVSALAFGGDANTVDHAWDLRSHLAEQSLVLSQSGLGLLVGGDVHEHAVASDAILVARLHNGGHLHPLDRTIAQAHAVFNGNLLVVRHGAIKMRLNGRPVVLVHQAGQQIAIRQNLLRFKRKHSPNAVAHKTVGTFSLGRDVQPVNHARHLRSHPA